MSIKRVTLENRAGDVYHARTDAAVVLMADGKDVEKVIGEIRGGVLTGTDVRRIVDEVLVSAAVDGGEF